MASHEENKNKPVYKRVAFWLLLIIIIICIAISNGGTKETSTNTIKEETKNDGKITLDEFNQIQTGMTYEEIIKILGGEGTILSESNIGNSEQYHTIIYTWEGKGSLGANANVTIQGGKVVSKAQAGLK